MSAGAAPASAAAPARSAELQRLQHGPILPTLLRLALPNVLMLVTQVMVAIAETWYAGRLGTVPLAAMAVVFPFVMLTQQMSAGAMGGGVSSAISRALGAADLQRAQVLAFHAIVIGGSLGVVWSAFVLLAGPTVYRWLGADGPVLQEAVRFSTLLFAGAMLLWISNTLAAVLRGTGNMRMPSQTLIVTLALQIVVGGVLALGAGPVPSLGLIGVAIGNLVGMAAGALFLTWYLMSGRARLTLRLRGIALRREMFIDILKVGAVACFFSIQSVVAVQVFTGMMGQLGVVPLAGYGIGQRLEFLLVPLSFGMGAAAVPMVGMAIGAGNVARARRVAWTAATVSAGVMGVIGAVVAIWPDLWAGLFTTDEAVLAHAREYLRIAGWAFPVFGFGVTLYFASQGSGKVLGPVLAATVRLVVVAAVGALLVTYAAPVSAYYWLAPSAMVTYGLACALAVKLTRWGPPPERS